MILYEAEQMAEELNHLLGHEIHAAARTGDLDRLRAAEDRGGSLEYVDAERGDAWTPLMIASINNHVGIIRYLVSRNVHLHTMDRWGLNALHRAAWYGNVDAVVELMEAGIDHTTVDICRGQTAYQYAEESPETEAAIASFVAK